LVVLILTLVDERSHARFSFNGPVFGLDSAPDGSEFVTDVSTGVLEIRDGLASVVAELPGATDVAVLGRGNMYAITSPGFGGSGRLYRVAKGVTRQIADLLDFETRENPDGGIIESNPFDVAILNGGEVLVADAAANALVFANLAGAVDWVASFPSEPVSTSHVKQLVGCPAGPPDICGLPAIIPAQAVPTSIAIGPDGAYYVGELKGFPAPKGESRVWRVEPGTRRADCATSPACQIVAGGFTSIIDLTFGRDGTLYVVELDENGWFAIEPFVNQGIGGTVNACSGLTNTCSVVAGSLPLVTAATVTNHGALRVVINALLPTATIVTLP
jgi:hypothetical protein